MVPKLRNRQNASSSDEWDKIVTTGTSLWGLPGVCAGITGVIYIAPLAMIIGVIYIAPLGMIFSLLGNNYSF